MRLTLIATEDLEAIGAGRPAAQRRAIGVRRLAEAAHRQGALGSQTDLALLGGSSQTAISNAVVAFRERGELLPLRGYLATWAAGRPTSRPSSGCTCRGLTTPDIAARTHHTKQAVDRYLQGYERLRLLAAKFAPEELPLLTGMSQGLIDQYLALLEEHRPATTSARQVKRHAMP